MLNKGKELNKPAVCSKEIIKGYENLSELICDLLEWHAIEEQSSYNPAKAEEYSARYKNIVARLAKSSAKKIVLSGVIKRNKLSATETFILVRFLVLLFCRNNIKKSYMAESFIKYCGSIVPKQEIMSFFIDGKNKLVENGIVDIKEGVLILKKPLLIKAENYNKKNTKTKKLTLEPEAVIKELDKYVIGQDEAKKQIVAAVFEHILKCEAVKKGSNTVFSKNNVFISGPTGSGKSYICQCLARILKIPFVHADATQYTQAGYCGTDIGNMFLPLLPPLAKKGKLPLSIIFIDEIDKIHSGSEKWGSSSTNVQSELLRILEGNTFTGDVKGEGTLNIDISQVLFIVGGAFEDLHTNHKNNQIGFDRRCDIFTKTLTADDYINYGMLPELIGRFGYFVQLHYLDKSDLRKILLNPHNGPVQQYAELLNNDKPFDESIIEEIIDITYKKQLGARGLNQKVGQFFQKAFLEKSVKVDL